MDLLTFLVGFLTTVFIIRFLWPTKRPKNFPPGPPAWIPFFANAFDLGDLGHLKAMKMGDKYGPIIGLQFGSYWTVILNNPDDIREAFGKPEFSGRYGYNPFLEENISEATKGVVMSFGQTWVDGRRFCLKSLRDHGFGKRSMESIIQEEVEVLLEELAKKVGTPMSTQGVYNASVLNVIWAVVAGERFKLDDERLEELLRFIYELMKNSFDGIKIFNFMFPTVADLSVRVQKYFPSINKRRQELLKAFLKKTVNDHRVTMQVGNPRDFIDTFLEERMKETENGGSSGKDDGDLDLIFTLLDLFGAGSETTSTTLNWGTFFLALHPDKQEKFYKEIESVVGKSRRVSLEDRANMPYSQAMMSEIYRMSSLAAMSVPHATTEDVIFKGYRIPKNTTVFGNFYAVHFSPEIWGDPRKFRPERFLSQDEKTFVRNPNLVPFSVGKRQCLGETLARDEFMIFLTNIVQRFKITMPPDEPQHDMEGQDGLVLTPEAHRIILLDRNK